MISLNVLVVDDSVVMVKKLTEIIEGFGHKVIAIAWNGKDAIKAYERFKPDIITMDIVMPDMNGVEVVKYIKKKYEEALIIMVSAIGQKDTVAEAIKAGARGYILKPFKNDEIESQINIMIRKFFKEKKD